MSIVRFRYRIYFTKTDAARFIGHLDLQDLVQRAFKRTKLPVSYSEGFNPHQLLSFAAPLPLGTVGLGEILEIFLTEQVAPDAIVAALNVQMPGGITVLRAQEVSATGKGAAALARAATYRITFPGDAELAEKLGKIVAHVLAADKIEIEKKTKKGRAIADIRPDILELSCSLTDGKICINAVLSTGSARNLKPELLMEHIATDCIIDTDSIIYERVDILLDEASK